MRIIPTLAIAIAATFATSAAFAGDHGNHGEKASYGAADKGSNGDIVAVASGAGQFNTLVAAVQAAGLVQTLQGPGPFTVFAPTDAAFEALPAGTVETLLQPANKDQLVALLTYHVVPGKVESGQVGAMDTATTVNGADIRIGTENGGVQINDANVVSADVMASNGVIHVIDKVIMPPSN